MYELLFCFSVAILYLFDMPIIKEAATIEIMETPTQDVVIRVVGACTMGNYRSFGYR